MDKAIVVIGVGGGVGGAVARQLIEADRRVIGTVRSSDQFAAVRSAVPGMADLIALDLSDADAIAGTLEPQLASIDVAGVIICTAICDFGPLELEPLAKVRQMFEVNTIANLAIYQACMPSLRRSGGRLVIVNSHSGMITLPFLGSYQASKFALEALADVMRMEAAKWGVRVVLIEPGGMDTAMSRGMGQRLPAAIENLAAEEAEHYGDLYQGFGEILASAANLTPLTTVANSVVHAFDAPDPAPRYPVGEDTEFMLNQRQTLTEREWDKFARSLFGLTEPG